MDQCEDIEEGAPPFKSTLCGEEESQNKAQRNEPGPGDDLSCVSLRNEFSNNFISDIKDSSSGVGEDERQSKAQSNQPGYEPSLMSYKSTHSMAAPLQFSVRISEVEQVDQQHQTQLNSIFLLLEDNIITFVKKELKKFEKLLNQRGDEEELEGEDEEERSNRESLMKITENFLRRMKQEELADLLQKRFSAEVCRNKVQSGLKKKFQCVFEGIAKAGNPTLLNDIYTDLYITEGGTGELNEEHEVRQIEAASRKAGRAETGIRREELFQLPAGRQEPIRTVMTKGVAGIGKTVLTQKFTLDWAEGKTNRNINFIFPFTFRELNVLKEEKFSLVELVHHFFPETKEAGICNFENFQIIFIFDGLDECRLSLDFHKTQILTDPRKSISGGDLLINLIRGNLLPSARLWITTRPAAANQIPAGYVDMVTEVRGFNDPQKEEYFKKRFRDEEQANRIVSHIKRSRSLHIMCHIPVFCWITATVLEDLLKSKGGGELPKSLTEMYIHFLVVQAKVKKVKYDGGAETDPHWSPESKKMMESLGKLAFEQLEKGNLIFYESDLTECGIDIRAASVYSGVFTQIFKEERGLYQDKVFCFIHLSVQEFLAALHVHLTFISSGVNLMEKKLKIYWFSFLLENNSAQFYQSAVNKALQSPNGHLDLFLRFLLGLSLQTNQSLLQGLLTQTGSSLQTNQKTVQYIKKKINEDLSAEKSINLFHCLNELHDSSLVEEIQKSLSSGRLSTDKLSPAQWSALVFILLSSEEDLEVFDLKKYSASEEALLRLLPVIKASNKAILSNCDLSERSYAALSSVLSSQSSRITDLDLSDNNLQDSGIHHLSAGLGSQHCKLEILRMKNCSLSKNSCENLSSALKSNPSNLIDLDLSENSLQDSGFLHLCVFLESPDCRLKTLRLENCNLSEMSCKVLGAALKSNPSNLIEMDLSENNLLDSGFLHLCDFLNSPDRILKILRLKNCSLSKTSCEALGSALKFNSSNQIELDLSCNNIQDSGFLYLHDFLDSSNCRLQTLRLKYCSLSSISLEKLGSALKSNPSNLTDLDLSGNKLKDSGFLHLRGFLESPVCRLQTLRLANCSLAEISFEALGSALSTNPSNLRELDLSMNNLKDLGFLHLRGFLENPDCRLQTLRLKKCSLSEISCDPLGSSLKNNPSNLIDLDLSENNLHDSGFSLLCGFLESPDCRLQTLRLEKCSLSEISSTALGSALKSNPSHMTALDLSENDLQDSDFGQLCGFLESPNCRLQTLRLKKCNLSESRCKALGAALMSNPSNLTELGLSNNFVLDSGFHYLRGFLKSPSCILQTLRLSKCSLSKTSAEVLGSALKSNPSHLRELDLSKNYLQDAGFGQLRGFLESPNCRLHTLRLEDCSLSEISCEVLGSALNSNPSNLTELDLSHNNLKDSVVPLCSFLESPNCRLQTLRLKKCNLSKTSCENLGSSLKSKPHTLTELDLSNNDLQDEGFCSLCCFLESSHNRLKTLRLRDCSLSKNSCIALVSALKSNRFYLKELDLRENYLQDSDVQQLQDLVTNPDFQLQTLRWKY